MKKKKKRVLVILGGRSREREISLETGKACIREIKKLGYNVIKFDPKLSSLDEIKKKKYKLNF